MYPFKNLHSLFLARLKTSPSHSRKLFKRGEYKTTLFSNVQPPQKGRTFPGSAIDQRGGGGPQPPWGLQSPGPLAQCFVCDPTLRRVPVV